MTGIGKIAVLLLLLLLPGRCLGAPAAEPLRAALLGDSPAAAGLADLVVSSAADGGPVYLERTAVEQVVSELRLRQDRWAEAGAARAFALEQVDFFGMISTLPASSAAAEPEPGVLTLFDCGTGVRLARLRLTGAVEERCRQIDRAVRRAAARRKNGEPDIPIAIAAFRNAAYLKAGEIGNLENNLNCGLSALDGVIVLERDYLEHLSREEALSSAVVALRRAALLLSGECLPDGAGSYRTRLVLATPDGRRIWSDEFAGGLRNDAGEQLRRLAAALNRPFSGPPPTADAEAKLYFAEFHYARSAGRRAEALRRISAAIALAPERDLYRAWAIDSLELIGAATPDEIRAALARIDELCSGRKSGYLLRKAESARRNLRERLNPPVLPPAPAKTAVSAGPSGEELPPVPLTDIFSWNRQQRPLLGVCRLRDECYLLRGTPAGGWSLYAVRADRTVAAGDGRPDGFFAASGLALVAVGGKLTAVGLDSGKQSRLPDAPAAPIRAATVQRGRVYAFTGDGYHESVLFSCPATGGELRIEVNRHALEKRNRLERERHPLLPLWLTAAPDGDTLYFAAHTISNGKGGYAGVWAFQPASGAVREVAALREAGSTRSLLGPAPEQNFVQQDGPLLCWANAGSRLTGDRVTRGVLFAVFHPEDGSFRIAAAHPRTWVPGQPARRDAGEVTAAAFAVAGGELFLALPSGRLRRVENGREFAFPPEVRALFADEARGVLTAVTDGAVREVKIEWLTASSKGEKR